MNSVKNHSQFKLSSPCEDDVRLMHEAFLEASNGYEQGGVPVGAVMVENGKVIARGCNQRVQQGDSVMHGETSCLRNAGLRESYDGVHLYTTLSPCMMCAGAIIHFDIKRVVVGEDVNFLGNIDFLLERGVEVVLLDDKNCKELMGKFIKEKPGIWFEDIAGKEHV